MLSFIAQYNKHDGPNGARQYKLLLDIDESHKEGFRKIMDFTKGDTFLVMMLPINEEFSTVNEAINETEEMTKTRLRKQLYALIRTVAKAKGLSIDEIKTSLKEILIQKKYMLTSTSDLDITGFAAGIYVLQNEFT